MLVDLVDRADVRMVQRRRHPGFAQEALRAGPIEAVLGAQELERDRAMQLDVLGLEDDAHAAGAERFEDAVVRDDLANHRENRSLEPARRNVNRAPRVCLEAENYRSDTHRRQTTFLSNGGHRRVIRVTARTVVASVHAARAAFVGRNLTHGRRHDPPRLVANLHAHPDGDPPDLQQPAAQGGALEYGCVGRSKKRPPCDEHAAVGRRRSADTRNCTSARPRASAARGVHVHAVDGFGDARRSRRA